MHVHARAASQTVSGHPAKAKGSPPPKSRSNKENSANSAAPATAATHSVTGLKQPSTIPRPGFKSSTASSRHKQLSASLNVNAEGVLPAAAQVVVVKEAVAAAPTMLPKPATTSSSALRPSSADLSTSSLIPLPTPSSTSAAPAFTSTSSTLAAIPQTPIATKRNRLTFADLSGLPQSERDAHREKILADLSQQSTLTASLTSLYPAALDADIEASLRFKVTAKRFDYKPKIEQLERKVDLLRTALSALSDRREQTLSLAADVEARWHSDLVLCHTKIFDLTQKCYQLQASVKALQAQLKAMAGEKDAMMRDLSATVEGKERVEIVVKEYERTKLGLERRIEQLEADLRDHEHKAEDMIAARDDMTAVLFNQEKEITALADAKRKGEEEARALHERVQGLEGELAEGKENVYNLEKLRGELIKSMEKSLADLTRARVDCADKERQLDDLRKVERSQTQTIDGLRSAVTKLERERKDLEDRVDATNAQWTERHAADSDRWSADLAMLRKVKDDELTSLKAKLVRKESELAHLQATFQDADDTKRAISVELTTAREAVLRERKERVAIEHAHVRVEQELKYVQMELEGKREELSLLEKSREKEKRLEDERREDMRRANAEVEAKLSAITDDLKARDRDLKAASVAHSALTQQHSDLLSAHAQLTDDKAALVVREEILTSQVGSLTGELAAVTERAGRELSASVGEAGEWRRKYEEMAAELDSFKRYAGVSDKDQLERLVRLSVEAEVLRKQVADKGEVATRLMESERKLADVTRRLFEGEKRRRELHNAIQELKGNVRVMVRVRPSADADVIECCEDEKRMKVQGEEKQTAYTFDHVFAPAVKQSEVFDEVSSLIQSALDGYHVCLFSYGQTGSGKTFTMTGALSGEGSGIIPRSVAQILQSAQLYREEGWSFTLEASMLEIYNERVIDLLSPKGLADEEKGGAGLEVKRDADGRTVVPGSVRMAVCGQAEIVEMLRLAAKHRSVAATLMNARSSRSHSIFTLYLTGTNATSRTSLVGSLNLCDLAGSERLSKSHAEGARLKETQAINKSLSALADVFTALGSGSKHVPYRNSKLTYLLQPCLSGDGKTLMIVNVSGERSDVGETVCSLRFASMVNQCELGKPKKNARVERVQDDEEKEISAGDSSDHNHNGSGAAVQPAPAALQKKPSLKASMGKR